MKNFVEFIYCGCGCGKTRPLIDEKGRKRKFIWSHQNIGRDRSDVGGENHWNYNGGRIKHKSGYWMIRKPDHPFAGNRGYVMEHRLVYEEYYNCCLLPWIEIHHINGNKEDNRIENLLSMTKENHRKYHRHLHKSSF